MRSTSCEWKGRVEERGAGSDQGRRARGEETLNSHTCTPPCLSLFLYFLSPPLPFLFLLLLCPLPCHNSDLDGTGYITHENLKKVMGDSATDAEVAAMIAEADFAHDGKITLDEFKTMMAGVVNRPETDAHMLKTRKRAKTIVGADLAKLKSNIEMAITKKRSKSVVSATGASPSVEDFRSTQELLSKRVVKDAALSKGASAQSV